jgi:hypothetical protein
MRIRGWLGAAAVVVLSVGADGCRRERMPPQSPPTPHDVDTSNMRRAGIPEQQGATPSGNTGEGQGIPGEGSAVKEPPAQEPVNARPAPAPPQDRR